MDLLNLLTKARADNLYKPLNDLIRRDLDDNDVELIILGSEYVYRQIMLEYSLELPLSGKSQSGELIFTNDLSGVDLSHRYSFFEPELDTVEFSADRSGGNILLRVQCIGLGENPVFQYRQTSIPIS